MRTKTLLPSYSSLAMNNVIVSLVTYLDKNTYYVRFGSEDVGKFPSAKAALEGIGSGACRTAEDGNRMENLELPTTLDLWTMAPSGSYTIKAGSK